MIIFFSRNFFLYKQLFRFFQIDKLFLSKQTNWKYLIWERIGKALVRIFTYRFTRYLFYGKEGHPNWMLTIQYHTIMISFKVMKRSLIIFYIVTVFTVQRWVDWPGYGNPPRSASTRKIKDGGQAGAGAGGGHPQRDRGVHPENGGCGAIQVHLWQNINILDLI